MPPHPDPLPQGPPCISALIWESLNIWPTSFTFLKDVQRRCGGTVILGASASLLLWLERRGCNGQLLCLSAAGVTGPPVLPAANGKHAAFYASAARPVVAPVPRPGACRHRYFQSQALLSSSDEGPNLALKINKLDGQDGVRWGVGKRVGVC